MNIKAAVLVGVSIVSLCCAQIGWISGTVKDSSGSAIAGAVVYLEKGGQTDTTGVDGGFTLTGVSGISNHIKQTLQHKVSATIHSGLLWVNIAEKSIVEVITFNLNGRMLSKVQQTMDYGTHSIALPHRQAGVYLYKVRTIRGALVLESNTLDGLSLGTAITAPGSVSYDLIPKQAKKTSAINDVIAVTKEGYLNYRDKALNSDTQGIEIKMTAWTLALMDIDGNEYKTVKIGNQVWMQENLRTTKYNDGTPIILDTSNVTWSNATTGKYCFYNNTANGDSIREFGALYNWYAVNTHKLAPAGWHVPAEAEWDTLEIYLTTRGYIWDVTTTENFRPVPAYNPDGTKTVNKIGKAMAAKTNWVLFKTLGTVGCDQTKNNRSGFTALPGGFRWDWSGHYYSIGKESYWWSAMKYDTSMAYCSYLSFDKVNLGRGRDLKLSGFSVRLLRD